jgi:hypothetical protein
MSDPNPCSDLSALFPEYLYDECSPEARREIGRHVAGCLACAEELRDLRSTLSALDHWRLEPVASDARAIAAAASGARARPPRPRRVLGRLVGLAGAAGFLLLCALGSELRLRGDELVLRLRLPWSAGVGVDPGMTAAVPTQAALGLDEERVQAIANEVVARHSAEEARILDDFSLAQGRERARLIEALDRTRAADRRMFLEAVDSVASRSVQENERTRDALVELVSFVTDPVQNPR